MSVVWIINYLFNYQNLPYIFLLTLSLPLLWTTGLLWWNGSSREIPIYFIGRWVPRSHDLLVAILIVVVEMVAFYAFGWGQRSPVEQPEVELELLVPIAEEVIFRGLILTALLSHARGQLWAPVLISALVFTSFHGIQNSWHLARIMTLGILLGVGYVKTRSIPYCVFCHSLWNAMCCCPLMQHAK